MNKLSRRSLILISALLLISIIALVVTFALKKPGKTAIITKSGEEIAALPLNKDTTLNLKTNIIKVENNTVYMLKADCPDKICVAHRPISRSGEAIICMPNRIIVEIRE